MLTIFQPKTDKTPLECLKSLLISMVTVPELGSLQKQILVRSLEEHYEPQLPAVPLLTYPT